MAKMAVSLPEELEQRLSRLGANFDPVAEKLLETGGRVVLAKAKENLSAVVGTDTKYPSRSTGELARSLGLTKVRLGSDGNHNIKVGFAPDRSDGKSNAMIAGVLEYGKRGQPARPFMKPAERQSKDDAAAEMARVFDEEVGRL